MTPATRTIGAGLTNITTTDNVLNIDTTLGVATLTLPSIASWFELKNKSGSIYDADGLRFTDVGGVSAANNIIFTPSSGDLINGLSNIVIDISRASGILTPTIDGDGNNTNSWEFSYVGAQSSTSLPNNPLSFYLDGNVATAGNGSIEAPFKTITELNNAIIALDPTKTYIGNIAPCENSYGQEVVGALPLAPNLSLIGQLAPITSIACDINLTATATLIIPMYRFVAFNGVFTVDLTLAQFASITFDGGVVELVRIDSNPIAFVTLRGGMGASTISGSVNMYECLLLADINVMPAATVYCSGLFNPLGGKFKLTGNCTLKTLVTLNPSNGYVDGTVDGSGTPIWLTDSASDASYTGTVNKTVY